VGWQWVHLVRRPLFGLLYQPRMIDECGAVGGIRICRGNRRTRRKSAPVPLGPPQIPHDLGSNRGRRGGKPATNRPSYGTAFNLKVTCLFMKFAYFYSNHVRRSPRRKPEISTKTFLPSFFYYWSSWIHVFYIPPKAVRISKYSLVTQFYVQYQGIL
jgi:hypothetical protein